MQKRYIIAGYRFVFGLLGLVALATQYAYNTQHIDDYQPLNFFSYFTVESNIFAVIVLLIAGVGAVLGKRHDTFAFFRGATTVYIMMTGIIYGLLLSGIDVNTALPWVNVVLHYILPAVVLADWLIDPPHRPIPFKLALAWLAFPLAYALYSLVRGSFVNWYPYPFLDPREQGYSAVIVTALIIAAAAAAIVWTVARVTQFEALKSTGSKQHRTKTKD